MNVAELDDGEAGQRGGQPGDRQLDINDPGEAARVPEADEAEQRGEGDYRERRVASQGIEVEGARPIPLRGDQDDERDLAQQRQKQQDGENDHRKNTATKQQNRQRDTKAGEPEK